MVGNSQRRTGFIHRSRCKVLRCNNHFFLSLAPLSLPSLSGKSQPLHISYPLKSCWRFFGRPSSKKKMLHFQFIFSGNPCGKAVPVVGTSSDDCLPVFVRHLKLSLGRLPDRHCPHHAVAANRVSYSSDTNTTRQTAGLDGYFNVLLCWLCKTPLRRAIMLACVAALEHLVRMHPQESPRAGAKAQKQGWFSKLTHQFVPGLLQQYQGFPLEHKPWSVLLTGGKTKSDGQMKLCYD